MEVLTEIVDGIASCHLHKDHHHIANDESVPVALATNHVDCSLQAFAHSEDLLLLDLIHDMAKLFNQIRMIFFKIAQC